MRTLYLLSAILSICLQAQAQTKSEISCWKPKNQFSRELTKVSAVVTSKKEGKIARIQEYDGNVLVKETVYNEQELPAEMRQYGANDTLSLLTLYTYNYAGQKVAETEQWVNGYISNARHYSYNEQGLPVSMSYCYEDKKNRDVAVTESYAYDNQNNLLSKSSRSEYSKYQQIWQYEYGINADNRRQVKEFLSINNRKPRLIKVSVFDSGNREIRTLEKNSGSSTLRTFTYVLNEQNDWVVKRVYEHKLFASMRLIEEYRKEVLE